MAISESENRRSPLFAWIALALAFIGAGSMLYYHLVLFLPRAREVSAAKGLAGRLAFGDDFYPVWLTTRQSRLEHLDLYGSEMTRKIQTELFGRPLDPNNPKDPPPDYRQFAYPAFTDLLFWPAAELPFTVVRIVLVVLLATLTLMSVYLWLQALSLRPNWIWLTVIFLLTLCSYPVLEGLFADQLGLLVGFLLAASIWALQRGRLLLAGTLAALATIKPQMSLLVIIYLLVWSFHDWGSRRRFCIGFFTATIVLSGAALIVWPHWIQSWVKVVLGYHHYANAPIVIEVLGLQTKTGMAAVVSMGVLLALLAPTPVLIWRNRGPEPGSKPFWLTLSLLLCVTTVALLPGQAVHDHVILLPGIFLLSSLRLRASSRWVVRMLLFLGIGILLWPWVASFGLIVLRPVISPERFYSKSIFALPLRTAAVFPFTVMALLVLARRGQHQDDIGTLSDLGRP